MTNRKEDMETDIITSEVGAKIWQFYAFRMTGPNNLRPRFLKTGRWNLTSSSKDLK